VKTSGVLPVPDWMAIAPTLTSEYCSGGMPVWQDLGTIRGQQAGEISAVRLRPGVGAGKAASRRSPPSRGMAQRREGSDWRARSSLSRSSALLSAQSASRERACLRKAFCVFLAEPGAQPDRANFFEYLLEVQCHGRIPAASGRIKLEHLYINSTIKTLKKQA